MLNGKQILLIIGGGIAAYKSLDLIRRLRKQGADVRCVLTRSGAKFVTPLSVASLSENKVYEDLFSLTDEAEMGHIRLSREVDLILVAPATGDLMAKMAHGLADDLASTVLLAANRPILIAPAMNVAMWENAATQNNLETLRARGVTAIGPNEGDMACGEYGFGRMAEPLEMVAAIEHYFSSAAPLSGFRALVTSGPTYEPIDPVRFIGNRSSGRQGQAIASALAGLGAQVTMVTGPVALPAPVGVETIRVETAAQMLAACQAAAPADIAVFAAAVGDWRVETRAAHKIKKQDGGVPSLVLAENPDILKTFSQNPRRPRLVIGFAAETTHLIDNAKAKLKAKGCDWIVANDVGRGSDTFGGEENIVHLLTDSGVEAWPKMSKSDIARKLAERIAETFAAANAVTHLGGEQEAG